MGFDALFLKTETGWNQNVMDKGVKGKSKAHYKSLLASVTTTALISYILRIFTGEVEKIKKLFDKRV